MKLSRSIYQSLSHSVESNSSEFEFGFLGSWNSITDQLPSRGRTRQRGNTGSDHGHLATSCLPQAAAAVSTFQHLDISKSNEEWPAVAAVRSGSRKKEELRKTLVATKDVFPFGSFRRWTSRGAAVTFYSAGQSAEVTQITELPKAPVIIPHQHPGGSGGGGGRSAYIQRPHA